MLLSTAQSEFILEEILMEQAREELQEALNKTNEFAKHFQKILERSIYGRLLNLQKKKFRKCWLILKV